MWLHANLRQPWTSVSSLVVSKKSMTIATRLRFPVENELLGTPLLDPTGEFTLNMVNVGLPLSPSIPEDGDTVLFLLCSLIEG